jgi:hypothetical protein
MDVCSDCLRRVHILNSEEHKFAPLLLEKGQVGEMEVKMKKIISCSFAVIFSATCVFAGGCGDGDCSTGNDFAGRVSDSEAGTVASGANNPARGGQVSGRADNGSVSGAGNLGSTGNIKAGSNQPAVSGNYGG